MPWLILNSEIPTEISEEDFDHLNGYEFILNGYGYLRTTKNLPQRLLHLIVAKRKGLDISKIIDHKDRNKYNNKRDNLREATNSQNVFNSNLAKNNVTGTTGIFFDNERQKWLTRIMVNGKHIFLGRFDDFEVAIKVRKEAEIKYFGEFSNYVPDGTGHNNTIKSGLANVSVCKN